MTRPSIQLSIGGRDLALLTLAAASWGIGTVVSKRAVDEIPPFTLLPVQLAASLVVLVVLMRMSRMPVHGAPPVLARLGILNPGIAYALGLIGLTWISASLAVLLWALEPLLILLLAGIFLREGITPDLVGLSLVAAVGMVLILFDPALGGAWPGVVLTLIGVACCAAYSIIARRFVAHSDSTAQVVLAQQTYALGFAVAVALIVTAVGGETSLAGVSAIGMVSAVVSGVLYYAAAYWFYLSALRRVPASIAATSFYLIPIFGVAAGVLALGDRLDPIQWLGVATVAVAVVLIALRPSRAPGAEPEAAATA
ncbi:MAG TPA: DMT family transporter [Candidatus Limnocylindrales bacterium]|nr:DMT family transporter [Candidatus Limnocylindrales bacterium]